jgi:hypothetical protein
VAGSRKEQKIHRKDAKAQRKEKGKREREKDKTQGRREHKETQRGKRVNVVMLLSPLRSVLVERMERDQVRG